MKEDHYRERVSDITAYVVRTNREKTYLASWINTQHISPPSRLFPTSALDEGDSLRSRDGQAVRMSSHTIRFAHFQDSCHVDAGLRDCVGLWEKEKGKLVNKIKSNIAN